MLEYKHNDCLRFSAYYTEFIPNTMCVTKNIARKIVSTWVVGHCKMYWYKSGKPRFLGMNVLAYRTAMKAAYNVLLFNNNQYYKPSNLSERTYWRIDQLVNCSKFSSWQINFLILKVKTNWFDSIKWTLTLILHDL